MDSSIRRNWKSGEAAGSTLRRGSSVFASALRKKVKQPDFPFGLIERRVDV